MKIAALAVLGLIVMLAAGSAEAGSPFASTPGVWDWNGPYFGANGGGSWGSSRWTSGPVTTGNSTWTEAWRARRSAMTGSMVTSLPAWSAISTGHG